MELKSRIPEISDARLTEMYAGIKPVVQTATGPYYIAHVDLRGTAFTWDPKPTKPATGLKVLEDIVTYHTFGAPLFFKPSIAEVLSQIPERTLARVAAFETGIGEVAVEGNYHRAVTRLYERAGGAGQ